MPRIINITLIFTLISFLTACNISGTVTEDGVGVPGVTVRLSTNPQESVVTDADGDFVFRSIDPGTYTVTLEPPDGYTRGISRTVNKSSASISLNFSLLSDTLRETETGKVIGFQEDNGTHAWLGIPFASPPVEERRWKAPLPASPWLDNTYLALQHSDRCIQAADDLYVLSGKAQYVGEPFGVEDCLYLNIRAPEFTPQTLPSGTDRLPVMVWIHGGANISGSASEYNGKVLVNDHNVIVVTINYRLGLFGWFSHPALQSGNALDDSGNYGTLDIIRALQWIQDNIANFGGDPGNVTIFGESAGAWNVLTMMLSPKAEGLFHKAISQSGRINTYDMPAVQNYIEDGGYYHSGREILNNLLIADGLAQDRKNAKTLQNTLSNQAIKQQLYGTSAQDIINAGNNEIGPDEILNDGVMPRWFLTKFRDGTVLPKENPLVQFQDTDNYNAVPLIIGSNRDEHKLYMMFEPEFVHTIAGLPLLPKNKKYYDLYATYKSEIWKIMGVDKIANTLRENPEQPDVFGYRFDWDEQPTIVFVDLPFILGAAHGMEIPFVFNYFDRFRGPQMDAMLYNKKNLPGRIQLGGSMSSYWAEFAYQGTPGMGRLQSEATHWAPWNNDAEEANLLIFDTPEGGDIHMANQRNNMEQLKQKLVEDTSFPTQSQHCAMYVELFAGTDFWDQQEYLNLGETGCHSD